MDKYTSSIVRLETTHKKIYWTMPFESTRTQVSRGTGFFLGIGINSGIKDNEGNIGRFIVTCQHVIKNSEYIRVVLPNDLDRKYNAAVVLSCPEIDVAIVVAFIPPEFNPNVLPIGNSDELESFEDRSVTAVGFPLGGGIKVSEGVFSGSARGRGIQHTSPISPGSSGCPLLDFAGRVVGVNSAGEVAATVSNIHYAVPINLAGVVLQDAVKARKILYRLPRLGICYQNASDAMLHHIQQNNTNVDQKQEGVIVHQFEDEFVRHLLDKNPEHRQKILQYCGSGQHTDGKEKKKCYSFFLTNIAWSEDFQQKAPTSMWFKSSVKYLLQSTSSAVDMNGLVRVAWTGQKIPLKSILKRIPASFEIKLSGWFDPVHGRSPPITLLCKKTCHKKGVFKELFYPFFVDGGTLEDTYFCFMGMCVVKLHYNHYLALADVLCVPNEVMQKTRFIISKIFDQTQLSDSRVFKVGDELTTLVTRDGEEKIECDTIQQLRKKICAVLKEEGQIGVKNQRNRWFHMNYEDIFKQENFMQKSRFYTPRKEIYQAIRAYVLKHGAQKLLNTEKQQKQEAESTETPKKGEVDDASKNPERELHDASKTQSSKRGQDGGYEKTSTKQDVASDLKGTTSPPKLKMDGGSEKEDINQNLISDESATDSSSDGEYTDDEYTEE